MRVINLSLPIGIGDNRIECFWTALSEELEARGGIAPGQVDFFTHPQQIMLVTIVVYELAAIQLLTQALRTSLRRIWPERNDLHVIESVLREGAPVLGVVRGGKSD